MSAIMMSSILPEKKTKTIVKNDAISVSDYATILLDSASAMSVTGPILVTSEGQRTMVTYKMLQQLASQLGSYIEDSNIFEHVTPRAPTVKNYSFHPMSPTVFGILSDPESSLGMVVVSDKYEIVQERGKDKLMPVTSALKQTEVSVKDILPMFDPSNTVLYTANSQNNVQSLFSLFDAHTPDSGKILLKHVKEFIDFAFRNYMVTAGFYDSSFAPTKPVYGPVVEELYKHAVLENLPFKTSVQYVDNGVQFQEIIEYSPELSKVSRTIGDAAGNVLESGTFEVINIYGKHMSKEFLKMNGFYSDKNKGAPITITEESIAEYIQRYAQLESPQDPASVVQSIKDSIIGTDSPTPSQMYTAFLKRVFTNSSQMKKKEKKEEEDLKKKLAKEQKERDAAVVPPIEPIKIDLEKIAIKTPQIMQVQAPVEVPQIQVPQVQAPVEVSVEVPQIQLQVPQVQAPVEVPQIQAPVEVPQIQAPVEVSQVPQVQAPVEVPQIQAPVEVPQVQAQVQPPLEVTPFPVQVQAPVIQSPAGLMSPVNSSALGSFPSLGQVPQVQAPQGLPQIQAPQGLPQSLGSFSQTGLTSPVTNSGSVDFGM